MKRNWASKNEERKMSKRMPIKVNLNVEITKNKRLLRGQKSDLYNDAPQTAVLNYGGSPRRNSDHDEQSLFLLTPNA